MLFAENSLIERLIVLVPFGRKIFVGERKTIPRNNETKHSVSEILSDQQAQKHVFFWVSGLEQPLALRPPLFGGPTFAPYRATFSGINVIYPSKRDIAIPLQTFSVLMTPGYSTHSKLLFRFDANSYSSSTFLKSCPARPNQLSFSTRNQLWTNISLVHIHIDFPVIQVDCFMNILHQRIFCLFLGRPISK